ncbi:hypothetical protein ESB04_08175 [Aquirufa rosea]|uniref:Glycosyltransferase RgtA/B/C/D-like domain-containing protein n=2 Tax=Aquirufa rosea TaxID=2509241 RepID=A0A4Q1BZD0_9BACT|nr:hypothetical protein ESB04_08175 [Aquirufa rosea]
MLPTLPSTMPSKEKLAWLLALGAILFFHFYRLHLYTLNFPNWGDDYAFLELIDYVKNHNLTENISYIFHFHNQIHRIAYARLWVVIQYAIGGELNFKTAIFLANLQLILLLIPFHLFLQKIKRSPWHLIGIACLLFSPLGNLDNYNLIGVLQHTGSILFLVWISYGLFYAENSFWVLFLALCYPFVSTEGLAFLPMVTYVWWTKNSKLKIVFSLLAITVIVFYFHDYVGTSSSKGSFSWLHLKGLLIFLGNWALPISDSFRAWINLLAGTLVLLYFTWKIIGSISIKLSFPALLFLQVLATGVLICLGRASMGDLELITLSDRFLLYGHITLLAVYGNLLINKNFTFRLAWGLLLSGAWMLASFFMARRPLQEITLRWKSDLLGAYFFQNASSYNCPEETIQLLTKSYFSFNPLEIPKKLPAFQEKNNIQILPFRQEFKDGQLALSWKNLPEKKSQTDQRFIVIKELQAHKTIFKIAALANDYPNRIKFSQATLGGNSSSTNVEIYLLNLSKEKITRAQYVCSLTLNN